MIVSLVFFPPFNVFCDLLVGTLSSQDGNAKEDFD